jgi:ATP-binding cassette subfamily C protein CydD
VQLGLRLLYGQIDFLPAFVVLVLAPEFYLPLRLLGLRFHSGTAGITAAQRIYAILDTPLPAPRLSPTQPAPQAIKGFDAPACQLYYRMVARRWKIFHQAACRAGALVVPAGRARHLAGLLLILAATSAIDEVGSP